jgi:hypothetical protein
LKQSHLKYFLSLTAFPVFGVSAHWPTGVSVAVLPDGIFSNQKSQFGKIFEVLQWKMLVFY